MPNLDECQKCPCFRVASCEECEYLDDWGDCRGVYPAHCRPLDCMEAKLLAEERGVAPWGTR
ncbi:MAG: hypothetical protein H5T97_09580 [Firmicutes bacterium]|nr:hypothetical protein [Bacillota bacterium]